MTPTSTGLPQVFDEPFIDIERINRTNPQSTYLQQYRRNEFSQFGEDGVIEQILKTIGERSRWCVEFGAFDGVYLSNTHALMRKGWNGVLIEGDQQRFAELTTNYTGNPHAVLLNAMVDFAPTNNLDFMLSQSQIPTDFDVLSIDIDGNDWHVWASVEKYRPRLVVIAFNSTVPNDVAFVQKRDFTINQGSSLLALIRLGKIKGYELVAITSGNAFFVVAEEFPKFGIADNSIDAMYFDVQSARIFQGYDATLMTVDLTLWWRGRKVAFDEVQLLTPEERGFGDSLTSKATTSKGTTLAVPLPPLEFSILVGSHSLPEFVTTGGQIVDFIGQHGLLEPGARFLDIGCGCGRVARHLIKHPIASYVGFDRHGPMIEWAQANIGAHFPNFKFEFADVKNIYTDLDQQEGKIPAAEFRFPYADASFDAILLASVFTHMPINEIGAYTREIRRVLSPKGAAIASVYFESDRPAHHGDFPYKAEEFDRAFADAKLKASMIHRAGPSVWYKLTRA